ncbi:paladin isoform X3 [Nematostella vectensis]|uniref:paladin isoform X3 n=1 Tax=Nematostella vectensis TaxID=45351 RepID=UPI002077131F|nr:paladin isoform X3 [Nematostella vectensis]
MIQLLGATGAFRCFDMGSAASTVASPPGSHHNIQQSAENSPINSAHRTRKASSVPKKQSNGFIVLSYAPTHTPLVRKRGRIKTGFPEHGLIQDKYFLIKDQFKGIDRLDTLKKYGAPNFRKASGSYPVYGMGQPSRDGLAVVIEELICRGHKEIVSFNLREEPVIFLSLNHDYIPYSPRDPNSLKGNIANYGVKPEELAETEIKIREEIIKLSIEEGGKFYFYHDVDNFDNEPHSYNISYEEHVCVMDEIYSRQIFLTPFLRYSRVPITATNAPEEQDFDQFINAIKDIPQVIDVNSAAPLPALIFNCHVGQGRTTTGMVIGCLIMCHRTGFPPDANTIPVLIDENRPNYEKGEFRIIQQLVRNLPNGSQVKQEVDAVIDVCSDVMNIRLGICECKRKLGEIKEDYVIEGQNARDYWIRRGLSYLERYFFLILFNAYLHEQFPLVFSQTFCRWMRHRPWIYRMLSHIDIKEKGATSEFMMRTHQPTCLVADEEFGMDVLSTQREVEVSNFRKVPGLPVYGMCQPNRKGPEKVIGLLTGPKYAHPRVVVVNLREDLVIDCDGETFSPRELKNISEHMPYKGLNSAEIEKKESELKGELLRKGKSRPVQVYVDVNSTHETREFSSVLTMREMFDEQMRHTPLLSYYRLPAPKDKAMEERDFDHLMNIVSSLEEIYTDEDGPALVFSCESGKERTTTAMVAACLIYCNKKGFPAGTKPDEQDPACVPNAKYTLGEFSVIRHLMRVLPNGPQRKREVDYCLDKVSETMTPMHYHAREVIFSTFHKYKYGCSDVPRDEKLDLRKRSLYYLERYFYFILFNTYLNMERRSKWDRSFSQWMTEVASSAGVYDILDNFGFHDFEKTEERLRALRWRWRESYRGKPEDN